MGSNPAGRAIHNVNAVRYSLNYNKDIVMTFEEAEAKLGEMAKGRFHSIYYNRTHYCDCRVDQGCRVYIDGYDMASGRSWDEALQRMQLLLNPVPAIDPGPVEEVNAPAQG